MEKNGGNHPYNCRLCPAKFFDMRRAKAHFLDVHEEKKQNKEDELPEVIELIDDHEEKKQDDVPELIEIIDVHEGKKQEVVELIDDHEGKKSDQGSSITVIGEIMKNSQVHKFKFNGGKVPYKCTICDASFIEKQKLNKHIAVIHMVKCDFCDSSFTFNDQLRQHLKEVHGKEQIFRCNICDATFDTKRKVNYHIGENHNNNYGAKYKCHKCDLGFKFQSHLRTHNQMIHKGKMIMYKCKYCHVKFSYHYELKRHIEEFHDSGGAGNKYIYQCNICKMASSKFNSIENLNVHMANEHGVKK